MLLVRWLWPLTFLKERDCPYTRNLSLLFIFVNVIDTFKNLTYDLKRLAPQVKGTLAYKRQGAFFILRRCNANA